MVLKMSLEVRKERVLDWEQERHSHGDLLRKLGSFFTLLAIFLLSFLVGFK